MVEQIVNMRSHKFRRNYKKDYLEFKKGKYDYTKRYREYHKYARLLESGHFDNQTWGVLQKAWVGYVIAKDKDEYDNLIKYASIIRKLQKELNLKVSDFPQLGMMASSLEDDYRDEEGDEKYTW
jgi:hypothetical protein